jgi:hypothetical protein
MEQTCNPRISKEPKRLAERLRHCLRIRLEDLKDVPDDRLRRIARIDEVNVIA